MRIMISHAFPSATKDFVIQEYYKVDISYNMVYFDVLSQHLKLFVKRISHAF